MSSPKRTTIAARKKINTTSFIYISHEQSIEYNLIPLKFHRFDVITAYKGKCLHLIPTRYFPLSIFFMLYFTLQKLVVIFCVCVSLLRLIYVLQFLMQYKFQLMSSTFVSICFILLQLPFFPFLISLKCSKKNCKKFATKGKR